MDIFNHISFDDLKRGGSKQSYFGLYVGYLDSAGVKNNHQKVKQQEKSVHTRADIYQ